MLNRAITEEEKSEIWRQLMIEEAGYKKAHELFEAACDNYDPIQYAVLKATKQLEKRKTKQ